MENSTLLLKTKKESEEDDTKEESYDFDELLIKKVGTFGRRQILLCILLVISNGCAAFHSLGPVFIAATPEHWCAVDKGNFPNCTGDNIKAITIPEEERDGEIVYSQCTMYSHNTSSFDFTRYCTSDDSATTWNSSQFTRTRYCDEWEYSTEYFSKTIVNEVSKNKYCSQQVFLFM